MDNMRREITCGRPGLWKTQLRSDKLNYSLIRDSKLSASGGAAITARFMWRVGLARDARARRGRADIELAWIERTHR